MAAGHVSARGSYKRSSETADPHRAHTRISYSPPRADAGPRTLPSLYIPVAVNAGDIATEPRYIPSSTLLDYDETESENYIYGSSREPWQTCTPQPDDIVQRVSSLSLSNKAAPGLGKDAQAHKETRSYVEVVKTSRDLHGRSFAARAASGFRRRRNGEPVGIPGQDHASGPVSLSQSPSLRNARAQHQKAVKHLCKPIAEGTTLKGTPRTIHRSFSETALHDGLLLKVGYWADERLQGLPEYQSLNLKSLDAVVQCPSSSSSSSKGQQSAWSSTESRGGRRGGAERGGGKRAVGDRDFHDNTGGDENDPKRPKSDPPQSPRTPKWYACHFHKHDPEYFSTNEATRMRYKSCGAKGWTEICRLKEHLYRVHKDLPKCDKCQKEFKKPEDLKAHLREKNESACQLQREVPSKGISPEIAKELHKRPKHTMTDEQRWFAIWRLLFPHEELPESPYSDVQVHETSDSHESETFHGYLEQRMSDHLIAKLDTSLKQVLPEDMKKLVMDIVLDQEQSSRHELWESYQLGATAEGQMSEGSENYNSAGSIAMANDPEAWELDQSSKALLIQPRVDNEAITAYPTPSTLQNQTQRLLYPQILPPATVSIRPYPPSTPVRQMSSSTYDSALGSELQSSADDEARYVNPAKIMTTPESHIPHPRTYNLPPPAMESSAASEITDMDQGHALSSPWSLHSPTPEAFDFQGVSTHDQYSDEDAPNSPDNYTFS
ncbi:uncharacterized protein PAC_08390 [Phialocephala subalpina]|uniref:C2H2-type domain-containing protein n=1 Tax=Phialocephala subalpina TaxID=576137 RepID=A0A1L7X0G0_9HELO|nr:uncharacterized protein PAC_08390 [Phialocephala subalpina]